MSYIRQFSFFLSEGEKEQLSVWKENVIDKSIVNNVVNPIFDLLCTLVPDFVAPNVLTLSGTFAVLQAWYLCETYAAAQPAVVNVACIALVGVFWLLGGIDGKHARRVMMDTSLGELFKYVCDLISSVFLVLVLCKLLIDEDLNAQWYCVQSVQLVLLLKHFSAFRREAGLRYLLVGPGELISWAIGLLLLRAVFGLSLLDFVYKITWGFLCEWAVVTFNLDRSGYLATMSPSRAVYLTTFYLAMFRIAFSLTNEKTHGWTKKCLLLILALRGLSGVLLIDILTSNNITKWDVILDGIMMVMVTSDVIVAKMAGRELHSWIPLMVTMVVVPHLHLVILCFVGFYFITVFADICFHMNLPLLQMYRNVYCDGVYDLCHIGHKNHFRRAMKFGHRVFVGVVGDKDANNYKRPPVMTAKERETEVASCKGVTKVIADAPCFGLTEEFIREHRIHVVCMGEEYFERFPNPDDDPYYKVPRKMGIAVPMPRTTTLSTSELIKRIQTSEARMDSKAPT